MSHATFNYVRTYRLRHALTRRELALLIGQRSATAISRFESGQRVPRLRSALALQVIFGPMPHDIFPGIYEDVEEDVMRRALQLREQLEGRTDRRSSAKLELLDAIPARGWASDSSL